MYPVDWVIRDPLKHMRRYTSGSMPFNLQPAFSEVSADFAISCRLSQGATMVAALWGVFIWKEFCAAPIGTSGLLCAMFSCFLTGLALIVVARTP